MFLTIKLKLYYNKEEKDKFKGFRSENKMLSTNCQQNVDNMKETKEILINRIDDFLLDSILLY